MGQQGHFFVELLGTRPDWPEHMTADEERIMEAHFQYLMDLTAEKKVLLAGPCFDPVFGLIILQTETEEEAVAIMDREPSVVGGVHTYRMHPMRVSLLAEHRSPERLVREPSDIVLRKELTVGASLAAVWTAWTTSDGARSFFAPDADIHLALGGKYEVYFVMDAPAGQRGSEGCRVLGWLPQEMLAFEWNAPPAFGPLRPIHTFVVVQLKPMGADSVQVVLTQSGWGTGEEWQELYAYFDRAWGLVLSNLARRFREGPLDWST